jgi:hypothetical protein
VIAGIVIIVGQAILQIGAIVGVLAWAKRRDRSPDLDVAIAYADGVADRAREDES